MRCATVTGTARAAAAGGTPASTARTVGSHRPICGSKPGNTQ